MEAVQQPDDLAQRHAMADRNAAIGPLRPMGAALHGIQNFIDQVVDVDQLQLHCRVGGGNGQLTGNIVAERRHHRVVVGPAPLAKQVRQAVDQSVRAGLLAISENQLLRRFLGLSVGASCKTSGQAGLNGGRQQHRAAVPAFPEHFQKRPREVRIPGCKFFRVFGPVHARQMHHKICFFAAVRKRLRRHFPRAAVNFTDLQGRSRSVPAVAERFQPRGQVPPDKAIRARHQYIHQQLPPNSFSFRSSAFISSTSSRCVLWELYCSAPLNAGLPLLK